MRKVLLKFLLVFIVCSLTVKGSVFAGDSMWKIEKPKTDSKKVKTAASKEIYFDTKDIKYDNNSGIGYSDKGVKVHNDENVLTADYFEYNSKDGNLSLVGNIEMDGQGNKVLMDTFVTDSSMTNAYGNNVRAMSADNSYIKAEALQRSDSSRNIFRHVNYTACDLGVSPDEMKHCTKKLDGAKPAWTLYAGKIVQDSAKKELYATNNILYLWNVPVFWLPYISYPDFTVKRQSGFLPVEFGTKQYGYYLNTPFFINLGKHQDLTISPYFTQKAGVIFTGQYRNRFKAGDTYNEGSFIKEKNTGDFRWYLNSINNYYISDVWKLSLNIDRSSDDTYLKKYDFSYKDWLTSDVKLGAYWKKNYFEATATAYQDLRYVDTASIQSTQESPYILPEFDYLFNSNTTKYGSFWEVKANAVNLSTFRNQSDGLQNSNNSRMSLDIYRKNNTIFSNGLVAESSLALKTDSFFMSNVYYGPVLATEVPESSQEMRAIPELNLKVKYPLYSRSGKVSSIIEPIFQAIVSPDSASYHNDKILNLDSLDVELDEKNLFSDNRFRGFDMVETGKRFNAGVKWDMTFDGSDKYLSFLLGQGFIDSKNTIYPTNSGLRDGFTDAVGSAKFHYSKDLDFYFRYRLDGQTYAMKKNDLGVNFNQKYYLLSAGYIYSAFNNDSSSINPNDIDYTQEIRFNGKVKVAKNWNLSGGIIDNLAVNEVMEWNLGFEFINDCLSLGATVAKRNTVDRDYKGSTYFKFNVSFRNLGGNGSKQVLDADRENNQLLHGDQSVVNSQNQMATQGDGNE